MIEIHAAKAGGALGEVVKKYGFGIKRSVALLFKQSSKTTGVFKSICRTISAIDTK